MKMLETEGRVLNLSASFSLLQRYCLVRILKADSHVQITKHEVQLCKYNVLTPFPMFTSDTEHLQI